MRMPLFRLRSLLGLIALVALLLWVGPFIASPTRWLGRGLLPDQSAHARRDAALRLGHSGLVPPWDVTRAVASLIGTLNDPNPQVRLAAASGLHGLAPHAGGAVPKLIALLSDESGSVRFTTALVLGDIVAVGGDLRDRDLAVTALNQTLRDPDVLVRLQAAKSLLRLGRPRDSVQGFVDALTCPNEQTQSWACSDLRGRTPPVGLVGGLTEVTLGEGPAARRCAALQALSQFAPPRVYQRILFRVADDKDPEVLQFASDRIAAFATSER